MSALDLWLLGWSGRGPLLCVCGRTLAGRRKGHTRLSQNRFSHGILPGQYGNVQTGHRKRQLSQSSLRRAHIGCVKAPAGCYTWCLFDYFACGTYRTVYVSCHCPRVPCRYTHTLHSQRRSSEDMDGLDTSWLPAGLVAPESQPASTSRRRGGVGGSKKRGETSLDNEEGEICKNMT